MKLLSLIFFFAGTFSALSATITWTGAGGDNMWNNNLNWSPTVLPGVSDQVIINGGNITLSSLVQIESLSVSNSTLFTGVVSEILQVIGTNAYFENSTLTNVSSYFEVQNLEFVNTDCSGGDFYAYCENITMSQSTFLGVAAYDFVKTGSSPNISTGGNTFSGTSFQLLTDTDWKFGTVNPDFFYTINIYNLSNSGTIYLAEGSSGNVFQNSVELDNGTGMPAGTRSIHICNNATSSATFNGTVTTNNNNSNGIYFGQNGGQSVFSASASIGSAGFVGGTLLLANSTFDNNPNLTSMFGTASLVLGPNTIFNNNATADAPRLFLNGVSFNNSGNFVLIKTGAGDDLSLGGNSINNNSSVQIRNNGTGDLIMGTVDPDIVGGTLVLINNTADRRMAFAESSSGNIVNGGLYLDNGTSIAPGTRTMTACKESSADLVINGLLNTMNNGSTGIYFGQNGGSTTFTASSSIGGPGFLEGTLLLSNITFDNACNLNYFYNNASLVLGPNAIFNSGITSESPRLFLNGARFNSSSTVVLTKNGAGNDLSLGGNYVTSTTNLQIRNNGTGDLIMGTSFADTIIGSLALINNTTDKRMAFAENSSGNLVNGTLYVDNGTSIAFGTRYMTVCRESGSSLIINGWLSTMNNGSTGIYFGENGGTTTFSSTATINGPGFVHGTLLLKNVTFDNSCTFNYLMGTASLVLGPNTSFNNGVIGDSPRLFFNGVNFNNSNTCSINKTGAGDDLSLGGNIVSNMTNVQIRNNGTGDLIMGTVDPDIVHGSLALINNSSDKRMAFAESSSGNIVNGTIYIDNGTSVPLGTRYMTVCRESGSTLEVNGWLNTMNNGSTGIFFGENGGQTTFNVSSTVSGPGFVDGTLLFKNVTFDNNCWFTFLYGSASLVLGPNTSFNNGVIGDSPRLFFNGTTFDNFSTNNLRKIGAGNDLSLGGNVITNSTSVTITNSGSGDLIMGTVSPDLVNGGLTLVNFTNTNRVAFAESSNGNTVNGLLTLDNGTSISSSNRTMSASKEASSSLTVNGTLNVMNNGSTGIYFGENGGQTTFSSTATLGGPGFVDGTLLLSNSTFNNDPVINFMFGTASLKLGPSTAFNATVAASSPRLFLNGASYNGSQSTLTKISSSDDLSDGGNVFGSIGTHRLRNAGSGDIVLGTLSPDIFAGQFFLENSSANNQIRVAENTTGNIINGIFVVQNGNLTFPTARSVEFAREATSSLTINGSLNLFNNSDGIYFGQNGGISTFTSTSDLLSSTSSFTNGSLKLKNIICNKVVSMCDLGGTATLELGPNSLFNNSFTSSSPGILVNGITTNDPLYLIKTGDSDNQSTGGNLFNDQVTLENNNTGLFSLAGSSDDQYNSNLFIFTNSSGNIDIASTNNALIFGDIQFNTNQSAIEGLNGGRLVFSGANSQNITNMGSTIPQINFLRMNKSGNDLSLQCPVNIGVEADFITGRIFTTSTNYLQFLDNAVVESNNISSNSFVHGPVRKMGDDFFAFPIGKDTRYQPAAIDPPSNVTDVFTGEYFPANSNDFYPHASRVPSLNNISTCDYWTVDRTVGSSAVAVWLSWNSPGCNGMTNASEVVIARWDGSTWQDHGQANLNGDINNGYMSTASAVSSFSPFALASLTPNNPLPVELLDIESEVTEQKTVNTVWSTSSENNSAYFLVERTLDGEHFENVGTVPAAGNSTTRQEYNIEDLHPYEGISYYRLTQFDTDGQFKSYPLQMIWIEGDSFEVYPNPATDVIHILLPKGNYPSFELNISDVHGTMVKSMKMDKISKEINIDISDLSVGVYHLVINTGTSFTLKKIIKE